MEDLQCSLEAAEEGEVFFVNVSLGEEREFQRNIEVDFIARDMRRVKGAKHPSELTEDAADRGDTYRNRGHEEGVGSRRQAGGPG
jgi:hypothetical protein